MQPLSSIRQFEDLLDRSREEPILIYKHSSRCPLSTRARTEVDSFDAESDLSIFEVVVQNDRAISDHVAETLEVRHETPQVILIRDGRPVYDASHREVTADALERATNGSTR